MAELKTDQNLFGLASILSTENRGKPEPTLFALCGAGSKAQCSPPARLEHVLIQFLQEKAEEAEHRVQALDELPSALLAFL